jgi:hypothetical protein
VHRIFAARGGDKMTKRDAPRSSDDRDTAERKSRSIDERVPDRQGPDAVPAAELPGAFGANLPQSGLGAAAPIGDDRGPGALALEQERKAQRAPIQRG